MKQPIITLTTDFGIQSQGIGNMEGVIADIAPTARVIHLMHGLPSFDLRSAARTMETVAYMPVGVHVCVVDPGVGTDRKPLIIQTKRGDYLIGPDNGVLLSAVAVLGGHKKVVAITNTKFMLLPISPIFHGRHIFAPAAAHLSNGVPIDQFGPVIGFNTLEPAPYQEATIKNGIIEAEVITINKFGSLNLNILHATWNTFGVLHKQMVKVTINGKTIPMPFVETFGQVKPQEPLILKDDYGRVEIAINLGDFAKKYKVTVGDKLLIKKP